MKTTLCSEIRILAPRCYVIFVHLTHFPKIFAWKRGPVICLYDYGDNAGLVCVNIVTY